MTSKAKNGAYEILAAQKSTVTKIAGVITPEAVDNLENEIGGIFTILKSNRFDEGQCYGYLTCVIQEDEDKDKDKEQEEDEEKEEEAIIALALQHTQRICYISAVTMQTRHVLPKVTNQTPTSPNLDFG